MITVAAAAIVLLALYFTLAIREKDVPESIPISPVQHLDDRKQAIYDNLRDLQFEYRLGKLSDGDYQQNKQALQRELASVLAQTEEMVKRLGLVSAKTQPKQTLKKAAPAPATYGCSSCGAKFLQPLKFCGECGKEMS